MKKLFLLTIVLLLSACGSGAESVSGVSSGLEGTYVSSKMPESLIFKSNGEMDWLKLDHIFMKGFYKIDGDQIKIDVSKKFNDESVMKLNKDGSIDGGIMHGTFTKK